LDSLSSYLEEEQRKKMDKKWLMWVIIFIVLANTVLSNSFYCFFLLALWETNPFGNFSLLKIYRLQPTLSKEQEHHYGFSQAQKEVLNFNYTKVLLIWLA
jgi:flagellar basal body-associated protein FliL